jgi:hypothetical protein
MVLFTNGIVYYFSCFQEENKEGLEVTFVSECHYSLEATLFRECYFYFENAVTVSITSLISFVKLGLADLFFSP